MIVQDTSVAAGGCNFSCLHPRPSERKKPPSLSSQANRGLSCRCRRRTCTGCFCPLCTASPTSPKSAQSSPRWRSASRGTSPSASLSGSGERWTFASTAGSKSVDDAYWTVWLQSREGESHRDLQFRVGNRQDLLWLWVYSQMLLETLKLMLICDDLLTRPVKHSGISCLDMKSLRYSSRGFSANEETLLNVWSSKSVVGQGIQHETMGNELSTDFGLTGGFGKFPFQWL